MNRKEIKTGKRLFIVMIIVSFMMTGCGGLWQETENTELTDQSLQLETEDIAVLFQNIYDNAEETESLGSLEMMKNIISYLGKSGYSAVDEKNQINMTEAEQVAEFCRSVELKKDGELRLIVAAYSGSFTVYDLKATDGKVDVVRNYYQYADGGLKNSNTVSYPAEGWQYTQEGYLLFEGSFQLESYYTLLLSDMSEHVALRVLPLDEKCRELNRKYLLPMGYGGNNMFLVQWSEADFGSLDFYDLFDKLYPAVYGQPIPYAAAPNSGVGTVYQVPENIFESVIQEYIRIDSEKLRQETVYFPENSSYEYKPRGFYESEYSEIPYPEVTDYTENEDGTVTLRVNAVYPEENTSKAYTHEVTVRPLDEAHFQYISNRLIYPEDGYDAWWHPERLTQEQWKEIYAENNSLEKEGAAMEEKTREKALSLYFPQEAKCLMDEAEREEVRNKVLTAAQGIKELYEDAETGTGFDTCRVRNFSKEQRKRAVMLLGEAGYTSVADNMNMENHEAVEAFYSSYQEKKDAMVTLFDVAPDGVIRAFTFLYRDERLQSYYVEVGWREGGVPEILSTQVSDIAQIRLTEKGYFIYAYEELVHHASLRQYWRIKPLSDECRELTEKYISGLSYMKYNMLITDWDSGNAETILMPSMFEDLYRMDTGESPKPQNGRIAAEIYERIMTAYFPVTVRQVRERCGYDAGQDNYPYETAACGPYPPFGEVVDYTENPDGTLTLFADGVWPDYDSDRAFRNRIVVEPFEDGSFRYLSNSIEKEEMDIPVIKSAGR
mgnify:CR=1 FL=1